MKINIDCGNKHLLFSKRICCYDNKTISIKCELEEKETLALRFNFHYDNEKTKRNLKISVLNGEFTIDLYNFNNSLGTGLIDPLKIATVNNKSIEMLFYVYKPIKSNPILDVALYQDR